MDVVEHSFWEYPMEKLNKVWITLQCCMNCVLKCNGGNDYKIPHMSKDKLERMGELPRTILAYNENDEESDDDDEDDEEEDNEEWLLYDNENDNDVFDEALAHVQD